ncbi:hypothetical protein RND81_13G031600 [Saponaria officinalis]|uniref:Jacalin-type lectin domain-containing protein n=1 Tax=Saponaria officinalis TaxID=3572 RepID=A0AAW1H3P7_SAPOF
MDSLLMRLGSLSLIKQGKPLQNYLTIPLQSNEYITQISGTYGKYAYSRSDSNVATLSIHTNLKQYGPYGREELVQNPSSFTSPTGSVVGFFGRHSNYLESIGVYLQY